MLEILIVKCRSIKNVQRVQWFDNQFSEHYNCAHMI